MKLPVAHSGSHKHLRALLWTLPKITCRSVSPCLFSLLICFLCWNGIAQEQEPLAELKHQCDQLERNFNWSQAIVVAEKILALTKDRHGEEHAETVDAMHTLARLLNCNGDHPRDEQLWQKTLA